MRTRILSVLVVLAGWAMVAASDASGAMVLAHSWLRPAGHPWAHTSAKRRRKHTTPISRPGCGQYCQQAGGFGGAGGSASSDRPKAVEIVSAVTRRTREGGAIPIVVHCRLGSTCQGALLLFRQADGQTLARSDLSVASHHTVAVEVGLSTAARQVLGSAPTVMIRAVADASQSRGASPALALATGQNIILIQGH